MISTMFRATIRFILRNPRLSLLGCILLASVGVWVWMDMVFSMRIARFRQQLRSEGRPAVWLDLEGPYLPDEENAWHFQMLAADIIEQYVAIPPTNSNELFPEDNPFNDKWMKMAEASETVNAKAYELAHHAAGLKQSAYNFPYHKYPSISKVMYDDYNSMKALSNALHDSAIYHHQRDDHALAIERAADLLQVGRSMGTEPMVVSASIAMSIYKDAFKTILTVAPSISESQDPKTRLNAERLLASLLDEKTMSEYVDNSTKGEWLMMVGYAQDIYSINPIYKPLAKAAEIHFYRQMRRQQRGYNLDNWKQAYYELSMARASIPPSLEILKSIDYYNWYDRHIQCLAESRIAAISVAWRLYRLDHNDQIPQTLDQLVPQYLPVVPLDPYKNQPIVYLPHQYKTPDNSADRPLLVYKSSSAEMGPNPDHAVYVWEYFRYTTPKSGAVPYIYQYRDLTAFKPSPSPLNAFYSQPGQPNKKGEDDRP